MRPSSWVVLSRRLLVAVSGLLLCFLFVGGADGSATALAASGQPQISVQPAPGDPNAVHKSSFLYDKIRGSVNDGHVVVTNTGTATGIVNLYPADAKTNPNGGIGYEEQNGTRKGIGAWLQLATEKLTLAAGESQRVAFRLTIPSNAPAGQHLGAIIAENTSTETANAKTTTSQKFQFAIRYLSADPVQVNVPGALHEELTVTGIQEAGVQGYQSLQIGVTNSGNVALDAQGSLQVLDSLGNQIQNLPVAVGTILPDDRNNYPVYVKKQAIAAGTYQAKIILRYGHHQSVQSSITFTITQTQVSQTFNNQPPPLSQPLLPTNGSSSPLWQLLVVGLLGLIAVKTFLSSIGKLVLAVSHRTKKGEPRNKPGKPHHVMPD